ncbi:MAG: diguanylate cyclase [Lachnospiraceae bacterium]|nr:diguanylate cyclase [Lachnospiraceae bacterium]
MDKELKGDGLSWILLRMNILPIILLTLVITTFSAVSFANSMNNEAKNGLVNLCDTVITMYDAIYEGAYRAVEQDGAVYLLKGEHQLNGDFVFIDSIKEKTNVDVTFFYRDTRVITTIRGNDGERIIGTRVNPSVAKEVIEGNKEAFFSNTEIEGGRYFSYYAPLHGEDGTCIGMIFVGKPAAEVDKMVQRSVTPTVIFGLLTMFLVSFITIRFSKKLVGSIQKIENFLESTSGGNLHVNLNPEVLERKDELGDMGRHVVKMQRALRELVEQDMLTGLNNRRSGEKLLKQVHDSYETKGVPYSLVIGDIDHFKYVNDTYGHECGDVVLVKCSALLREHMHGKGFAIRWGGEEFLLVYEGMNVETALPHLRKLMDALREMRIGYGEGEETQIGITMTFGLAEGSEERIEHVIRDADVKLYEGKSNGRDQIVF